MRENAYHSLAFGLERLAVKTAEGLGEIGGEESAVSPKPRWPREGFLDDHATSSLNTIHFIWLIRLSKNKKQGFPGTVHAFTQVNLPNTQCESTVGLHNYNLIDGQVVSGKNAETLRQESPCGKGTPPATIGTV